MEKIQLAVQRLLLVGVLLSFVTVVIGGSIYLFNHGADIVHFESFHNEPQAYKSIVDIFSAAFSFSSLGLVQLGLLILVFLQLLRVGMTAWSFIQSRDKFFTFISLFVLGILIYSIIFTI